MCWPEHFGERAKIILSMKPFLHWMDLIGVLCGWSTYEEMSQKVLPAVAHYFSTIFKKEKPAFKKNTVDATTWNTFVRKGEFWPLGRRVFCHIGSHLSSRFLFLYPSPTPTGSFLQDWNHEGFS